MIAIIIGAMISINAQSMMILSQYMVSQALSSSKPGVPNPWATDQYRSVAC